MKRTRVTVAGHICLDVIPAIPELGAGLSGLLVPGKLVNVGSALMSTGGAVSNTGLALHRLGFQTKLMGKVGDDFFGQVILQLLSQYEESLAQGMIVAKGEASSYTLVISPPGVDRIFLHCTGANDTFGTEDVTVEALNETALFHFGYPPLMRRMYQQEGEELATLLKRVKLKGITVSLDTAKPDPESEAGIADWRAILQKVLPHVDVFLPSLEELLYMLNRPLYEQMLSLYGAEGLLAHVDAGLLSGLADELLEYGSAIAVIKLGEHGLYMKTTSHLARIQAMGVCQPREGNEWLCRELFSPCFEVVAAGTTGAGDCTIAGFLAGLLKGLSPEAALSGAVGVGACNVEQADAVSGIPTWEAVMERIGNGWKQREIKLKFTEWQQQGLVLHAKGERT